MSQINARSKGKRGELEWVHVLKDHGYPAKRTAQYKGSVESFDVESEGPGRVQLWEVKRDKALNVWTAMEKSREEAEGQPFALAWRKDRADWVVCIDANHFFQLMEDMYQAG